MAKKKEVKKVKAPKKEQPKVYTKIDLANLKGGKYRPLDVDKVYMVKYDLASGKEVGSYKLSDILEYIGLKF